MRKFLKITAGIIVAMLMFQNCQKSDFLVITGVVRDANTNLPIEGAYVVWQNEHYTRTASDGTFSIDGVKPGKINFYAVSFNGYNQKYKSAIISDGRVNKVNFELTPIEKPEIETGTVNNITLHTATLTGSLHWKTENWSQYGFCWSSVNTEPTLSDGSVYVGSSSSDVTFSYNLTNLASDQIYYVRAYATSNAGTIYGNSVVFRTAETTVIGLVSSHSFSGFYNYQDDSGNGFYTYPWNFSSTTDRYGIPNFAAEFVGSGGIYFNNYSTPFEFQDFAISLWFYKPGSWESSSQKLFTIGYPYPGTRVYISQGASPNNFNFGINPSGTDYKVTLTTYPSTDTWHHVVAQRKGSKLQLYLDGSLVGEKTCSTDIIKNYDGWMFIGFTWLQEFFRGKMDDVKVYNKALSISEIQYLKSH